MAANLFFIQLHAFAKFQHKFLESGAIVSTSTLISDNALQVKNLLIYFSTKFVQGSITANSNLVEDDTILSRVLLEFTSDTFNANGIAQKSIEQIESLLNMIVSTVSNLDQSDYISFLKLLDLKESFKTADYKFIMFLDILISIIENSEEYFGFNQQNIKYPSLIVYTNGDGLQRYNYLNYPASLKKLKLLYFDLIVEREEKKLFL